MDLNPSDGNKLMIILQIKLSDGNKHNNILWNRSRHMTTSDYTVDLKLSDDYNWQHFAFEAVRWQQLNTLWIWSCQMTTTEHIVDLKLSEDNI